MDGGADTKSEKDRGVTTIRNAAAALICAEALMQLFPELGLSISSPAIGKLVEYLPGKGMTAPVVALLEAIFSCFGRVLWMNPKSLDEIFANDPNQEKSIVDVVRMWISTVSSVSVFVMISVQAQKITFISQKACALSLCSAVCRSPKVARLVGLEVLDFTKKLVEIESKTSLDVDSLVEAACGTTRKVVGDGPLGDTATRMAEISKSDPLLTVSLKEACDNAERAIKNM